MNIYVPVSEFYDYIPSAAEDADKQMADGSFAKRVVVKQPSETTIILSDQQVQTLLDASETLAADPAFMAEHPTYTKVSREQIVLGEFEKAMVAQAPREAWGEIAVHDDPAIAELLNTKFNTKGSSDEN